MKRLEGKVAVITGGSGGIGIAAGKLFAAEGAAVLLVGRNEAMLQQVVSEIGGETASYVVADVTDPAQVAGYVKIAVQRYGGIDVFINNAGSLGEVKPIVDYSIETFDKVMATNIRGVWLGLKYVIPEMAKRGGGSIVITSSVLGVSGSPGICAYVASKHAGIGLMRVAAKEAAPLGIRVNTVNPGPVETEMMRSMHMQSQLDDLEEAKQRLASLIPLNRYAEPADVAKMMLFLASDESRYCTGAIYFIDGGMSAG